MGGDPNNPGGGTGGIANTLVNGALTGVPDPLAISQGVMQETMKVTTDFIDAELQKKYAQLNQQMSIRGQQDGQDLATLYDAFLSVTGGITSKDEAYAKANNIDPKVVAEKRAARMAESLGLSASELQEIKQLLGVTEQVASKTAKLEAQLVTASNKAREGAAQGTQTGTILGVPLGIAGALGTSALAFTGTGAAWGLTAAAATGALALTPVGWVAIGGAAVGAFLLTKYAGNTIGGMTAMWDGLDHGDKVLEETRKPSHNLAAFKTQWDALNDLKPQDGLVLSTKFQPVLLQAKAIKSIEDPNASAEQKQNDSKEAVLGVMKFMVTKALGATGFVLTDDHYKTLLGMNLTEAKGYIRKLVASAGLNASLLTDEDLEKAYKYGKAVGAIKNNQASNIDYVQQVVNLSMDGDFQALADNVSSAAVTAGKGLGNIVSSWFSRILQMINDAVRGVAETALQPQAGTGNQNQGQGSGNSAEPTVSTTSITPDLVAGFTPPKNITGGQSVSQTQTPPRGGTASGVVLNPAG